MHLLAGMSGRLHDLITRAEKALLGRTLQGRRLERTVRTPGGRIVFRRGRQIDREVLDEARARGLLAELGHAAEPSTSETEVADLLWWRKQRRERDVARRGGG